MAKPKIDDASLYEVSLNKSVKVGRIVVSPSHKPPQIRGDALSAIIEQDPEAVASYKAV